MRRKPDNTPLEFVLRSCYGHWDSDSALEATIEFLRQARFQGIMLIPFYGHWEPNHFAEDLLAARAERIRQVIPVFRDAGFSVGLNVQTVGFTYSPPDLADFGFDFQVGRDGTQSTRSACPLSPRFHDYLDRMMGGYAIRGLDYIYIDDDFNYMVGGSACFCPLHMAAFSRAAGRQFTRQEWTSSPDFRPGRLGRIWGKVQIDALLAAARVMERAVHQPRPEIRMGVMGINGWVCDFGIEATLRLLDILRGPDGVAPVVRPGVASYWDWQRWVAHGANSHYSGLHVKKVLPTEVKELVELDAGAPWTMYDHGVEHLRYLVERSIGTGIRGFSHMLFPDCPGHTIPRNHPYTRMLRNCRARFDAMAELVGADPIFEGVDCRPVDGITPADPRCDHFYGVPALSLSRIGIPMAPTGEFVRVVWGPQPAAIGADNMPDYICDGAVVDAGAIGTMGLIGCNDLIGGMTIEPWDIPPSGLVLADHPLAGNLAGRHFSNLGSLRAKCRKLVGDFADSEVVSWWLDARLRRIGPAEVVIERGGRRFFLTAHGLDQQSPEAQILVANDLRQHVFVNVLEWIAGRPLPAVIRNGVDIHLFCMRSADGRRRILTLYNNGFNRFDKLTIELGALPRPRPTIRTVAEDGKFCILPSVNTKRTQDRWRVDLCGALVPGPFEVRVLALE